ncbi:cysteine synthase A [Lutibacter sp.]|uniref:cysteine synthase A n=1 Tax=Lutibacter sp. TaxID=1925666 RepID=UPI0035616DDB
MRKNNVLELIGNTPVVKINNLFNKNLEVWIKLEKQNPGGSIKDRIALAMVEDAEKKGLLNKETVIVEPTSGNTGIGLALVSAIKGYRIILVMPESMSIERRKLMTAYGAEIVLTPKEKGMKGAIEKATEIKNELNGWMPMQFDNPANPDIHAKTTAQEIIKDFPEGIDSLITGVGTGGHISGVAIELKKQYPAIEVYAVEPSDSPVISGGAPGPHALQGIGAGFIPKNLDVSILNGSIKVSKEEAFTFVQRAAKEEGLFIGISTGASLAAIYKVQNQYNNKRILTFAYDTGERYLSVEGLF